MIRGEQIISMEIIPYYTDGRKKPLWRVNYTYWTRYTNGVTATHRYYVYIDNPTLRRLERFKIERHKHNYLASIINRVKE